MHNDRTQAEEMDIAVRERRFKRVQIPDDILLSVLYGKVIMVNDTIPTDAHLWRTGFDNRAQSHYVVVAHQSFPKVETGSDIPLTKNAFRMVQ